MKLNKFSLAVAVAGVMASGAAYALAPNVTPDLEMWVSGATAQDNMLGELFSDLCVAGSLDTYLSVNSSTGVADGAAHRAFFCTLDSAKVPTVPGNPKVLFHKRSAGGSGFGVQPIADATPIAHMPVSAGNCTSLGANRYSCTGTVNQVSDAGISDVEPGLFVEPNVPAGFSGVTKAQLDKLTVQSSVGLVFGTPVTLALRNALQQAQGLTVGSDTEANMPNLSREQVASLFTGGIRKWDALKVNGVNLTTAPGVLPPADTKVQLCRRVNGSGTQAQFNAKFLRVPCTDGAALPLASGHPITGPVVTLNSGSGDVDNCLHNANNANNWAIGVQSLEKNADNAKNYRFIKIDGEAPTLKNVAANQYFDWAENSFQWRKTLAGSKLELIKKVASDAGKPAIIASANAAFNYTWGQSGYLALNTNGHTGNTPFNPANPVTTATHVSAGSLSNCRVPQVNKPSELF